MRIHFGFSKRISIKTILTLISALFVGLCAFLGITEHEIVFADTLDKVPSSFTYYNNTSSSSPISPTMDSNNYNYYWFITNPGSASFNFTYVYDFSSINCQSGKAELSAAFFLELNGVGFNQSSNNFSMSYQSGGSIYGSVAANSNGNGTLLTLRNVTLAKPVKIVMNTSDSALVNRAIVDRVWNYTCLTDSTGDIINNQNQNTQDIINNNNQNTQDIIDNQNANNQAMLDSQKVCSSYEPVIELENSYLTDNGGIGHSNNFGISKYYSFSSDLEINSATSVSTMYICFYTKSKVFISCSLLTGLPVGTTINYPSNSGFFRYTIDYRTQPLKPVINYCLNGNQAIVDSNNQLNDSLNDSNVDSNTGNDFFDMDINEHGIANILTSPIRLLQALTSSNNSCNSLDFTINLAGNSKAVSIPSGCILWDLVPNSISALFVAIVYGLFAYYVLIDLYKFIHGLLDPDDKNMYVLDL